MTDSPFHHQVGDETLLDHLSLHTQIFSQVEQDVEAHEEQLVLLPLERLLLHRILLA